MVTVKVVAMEWSETVMPNMDPDWRFALGGSPASRGVVVQLTGEDGTVGHGYAGELRHLGLSYAALIDALERWRSLVVAGDSFEMPSILEEMQQDAPGARHAACAVDIALHDLHAKVLGVPVFRLLGGRRPREIAVMRIIPLKSPAEMAELAAGLALEGYRYLKIKLAGDPDLDLERVRSIRQRVGSGLHLTVDANQSYQPKTAIRLIGRLEDLDVELAEQPVPRDDLEGLAQVTRSTRLLVEADESAQSLAEVFRILRLGAADAISLKPVKMGGLSNCRVAAQMCAAADVHCRIGACFGSRLLNAAGLHLAAATPHIDFACELGEFEHLRDDPAGGLDVAGGVLRPAERPGLGVAVGAGSAIPGTS